MGGLRVNCQEVRTEMSAFLDGELPAERVAVIQSHVSSCESCAGELRAFSAIGELLAATTLPTTAGPSVALRNWDAIAERLNAQPVQLAKTGFNFSGKRLGIFAALVLAGSLLLFVDPGQFRNHGDHEHNTSALSSGDVAIDFATLLDPASRSNQPDRAFEKLSDRYSGQEIAVGETATLLGYQPSIFRGLPAGVQLVSNKVLTLPNCKCEVGQCACGSSGCNCAATLCKRPDGSNFLVVEHCASQDITFGDLKSKRVRYGENEFSLLQSGRILTATWLFAQRRITAIGMASEDEAKTIIAGLAMR